ncbi:MAG: hypothetical protein R3Y32_06880 [Bacillota bacterium]
MLNLLRFIIILFIVLFAVDYLGYIDFFEFVEPDTAIFSFLSGIFGE